MGYRFCFSIRINPLYCLKLISKTVGITEKMTTHFRNRTNRISVIFISFVVMAALSISMAGVFSEADCDNDCQSESGTCYLCFCCPSNVAMTLAENQSVQFEYATCLWILTRAGATGEQEWFTNIDHPPRNLS